jgi:hypothetical protein
VRAVTAIAFSASSDLKLPVSPASTPAMYSSIGIAAVTNNRPSSARMSVAKSAFSGGASAAVIVYVPSTRIPEAAFSPSI